MEKNIGAGDKLIRVSVSLVIVVAYGQKIITGGVGYFFLGIALSLLITAFFRKSPMYDMFNINTNKD